MTTIMDQPQIREKVRQSMERAFTLGGDYVDLGESDNPSKYKRAGEKREQFLKLTEDLIACIDLSATRRTSTFPPWGDTVP